MRPLADHFPELPADRRVRLELEQFAGPVVGEQDALLGVEGDHAFDHAAEDGAQLLAVLVELGELRGQPFAHVVEGLGEDADFVAAFGVDLVAIVAGRYLPGPFDQFLDRLGNAAGQPKGEDQGEQPP